jgi:hypothetical protein
MVDGFTTKIACPTGSLRVLVYPSGVDVFTSTLRYLSRLLANPPTGSRHPASGLH